MVLNEPQKARDAYAHAVKLKPDDASLQQAYAEASRAAAPDST
jgi:cytochrome c-type biogenesis protein CcmH/NrfG